MPQAEAFPVTWRPQALAVLRIVVAFLILQHASSKFFGMPHVAFFDHLKLFSLLGLAGTIELVGGVLLLIGLFTRPAAFILCGELAFADFIGHASKGAFFSPILNGGESAVLFCFIFLYLSVAGAGSWSLDAARGGP